ncbi:MAG: hypothetical protein JSV09_08450 [Thermoplasmata archaeon]|nr:MAG: hypothetical protein JSV09_08450 [Thermoplasmata archaeon]
MVRKCPHCKAKVGQYANKCWKCKQPLEDSVTSPMTTVYQTKGGSKKKVMIITAIIIIVALIFVSVAYILLFSEEEGIEIKVFYDGPWEGTVMFYDTFIEMDAKVESGDYDEVSGSGNKVLRYSIPNKKYLSASFQAVESGGNPIKIEVWVNGKFALGTDDDYSLPNYTCTLNLDRYT